MTPDSVVAMLAPGIFLTWGILGIQLGNLIVIASIIVLFVLALVVPMPTGRKRK
jgi:hypothetical protein